MDITFQCVIKSIAFQKPHKPHFCLYISVWSTNLVDQGGVCFKVHLYIQHSTYIGYKFRTLYKSIYTGKSQKKVFMKTFHSKFLIDHHLFC